MPDEHELCTVTDEQVESDIGKEIIDPWDDPKEIDWPGGEE